MKILIDNDLREKINNDLLKMIDFVDIKNKVDEKYYVISQNEDIIKKCMLENKNCIYICTTNSYITDNIQCYKKEKNFDVNVIIYNLINNYKINNEKYKKINLSYLNNIYNKSTDYNTISQLNYFEKSILLTCGIGDFFVLDFFYDLSVFTYFYIIAPQCDILKKIIITLYDIDEKNIVVFNCKKELGLECFFTKNDIINNTQVNKSIKYNITNAEDYSIFIKFIEIRENIKNNMKLKYLSSFYNKKIADISHLNLPPKYFIISPHTDNTIFECIICNKIHNIFCDRTGNIRNFTKNDWDTTIKYLQCNNIIGVILSNISLNIINKNIIDLSGLLSFEQSIEVFKKAYGYVGIDSCMSVLAAYFFDVNNIIIKATNKHAYNFKDIYFYNKTGVITPSFNIKN